MKIIKPSVELLWITPNAEKMIERAGKVCYKSEDSITDDSAKLFVQKILERGHEAVIEHASASLLFICDRGVTHELVRHRLVSYCQESTRYCNYGKDKFGKEITVIEPPGLNDLTRSFWKQSVEETETQYMNLIDSGVSPQIARSVLPNCLKTEIIVTANFREWRHILKLRTSPAAHPQIREVMEITKKILQEQCPNLFGGL
jgi:thymidylate synthase (FAD)